MLEFLKNGSKIHIKEKNKGSFTRWCGGKVTDECIKRGKNSSNPKIRKKATFAANARTWKHLLGGTILKFQNPSGPIYELSNNYKLGGRLVKASEGTKLNFWLKAGNFLNSDGFSSVVNVGLGFLLNKALNELISGNADIFKAQTLSLYNEYLKNAFKLMLKDSQLSWMKWVQNYLSGKTLDNPSLIVAEHLGYNLYILNLNGGKLELLNLLNLIDAQTQAKISLNNSNFASSLISLGAGLLGNYLNKK